MREGIANVVDVDGARGEGGGQILRTSLALSMITGRPMVMRNIRAHRSKPGLRRQHLACVEAAAALSHATVHGAAVGAKYIEFSPAEDWLSRMPSELRVDIGTPGATTLVVQTVLVPALVAGTGLTLIVQGGTHNPMAPPFDFLERVFLPYLRRMGADVTLKLDRYGFASGGDIEAAVRERGQLTVTLAARASGASSRALQPIEVLEAAPITARRAICLIARLPTHVAARELSVVQQRLGFTSAECEVKDVSGEGGPANLLTLEVDRPGGGELVTSMGERGVRAEYVAARACDELESYLGANAPVGEHLADQLLLPLAVAGGGRFRSGPLSRHATTNIDTIRAFLDLPIQVETRDGTALVTLGRPIS